jgi:hypothetical protein
VSHLRNVSVLAAGIGVVAVLAACGPSSNSGAAAPADNVAAGGGSSDDAIGHPVTVCGLLPAATVAQVTGEPITVAQEQDTPSYKLYSCNYTSADGTSGLSISVLGLDASPGYDGALQADSSAKPISGLGDKAFSGITGLHALFGNVGITVANLTSDTAAEQLIRMIQPKI